MASLHAATELIVLSRPTRALQSFAAAPKPALSRSGSTVVVRVSCRVLVEPDLDGLLGSVSDTGADLLVVRHPRGMTGWRTMARRLAHESPCSLCLTPPGSPPLPTCIVAGMPREESAGAILRAAACIARRTCAREFLAVRTWSDWVMDPSQAALDRLREAEWLNWFRLIEHMDLEGVDCTPRIEETPEFSKGMLRVAQERGADLIVAPAPNGRRSWFPDRRSPQDGLVLRTQAPLLLLRSPKPPQPLRQRLWRLLAGPDVTFG